MKFFEHQKMQMHMFSLPDKQALLFLILKLSGCALKFYLLIQWEHIHI